MHRTDHGPPLSAAPGGVSEASPRTSVPPRGAGSVLEDVRSFLEGLRRDLPEVFRRPTAPSPSALPPDGRGGGGVFLERVGSWSECMGVRPGRVRVKEMSTLWGSCSPKGDLSFNEGLTKAPPEVLDYVVVHELAHLKWRGHGRRFWDMVERFCPDHRRHRQWLRKNGQGLLPS